jgi:hypothetical protein
MKKGGAWPKTMREFWLAGQVFGLVLILRVLMRWVKLDKLLNLLTPAKMPSSCDAATFQKLVCYVNAILWRFPTNPRGNCLSRSLTLYFFGIRYGLPLQFHCGVRQVDGVLKGHAWLSLDGDPILEPDNPFAIYAVMFSFPLHPPGQRGPINDSASLLAKQSNSSTEIDLKGP